MAWYDGTNDYTDEELEELFPVAVTNNLRFTKDGKRMALINDFDKDSEYYELSDPHVEKDWEGKHVFDHFFFGKDAVAANRGISDFISRADLKDGKSVLLLRRDADRLFSYAYGYICTGQMGEDYSGNFVSAGEESVYILPLKRFMFRCPVCGHRTLEEPGMFYVCVECGWEDEGNDDEDSESIGCNGDYTIREYREEYLRLKAKNPDYKWYYNGK